MRKKKENPVDEVFKKKEEELAKQLKEDYPLFFLEMHGGQIRAFNIKNPDGREPKRLILESGNKWGKTLWGLAKDVSYSNGFYPWIHPSKPEAKINVRIPNIGLIGCETMMHSVPEKIEPALKQLIPKTCKPIYKLNPQGVVSKITFPFDAEGKKCGSVIYIRSYDQHESTFEGIDYDWIHWDEPPPEKILKAAERGKIVTNAPSWFTMTPLKEPYIYDQFSLKAFTHGGIDNEIAVVRGSIWDNCRDWCRECAYMIIENIDSRVIKQCPRCNKILGFIPRSGIEEYLKTLPAEERLAREEGAWHHLSGLVYKELNREVHAYEDFSPPKHWTKIESIDPHDARPTRWLFGAISDEEIEIFGKKKNRIYFYDHLLVGGDLDNIVRQVKSKRELHGYSDPMMVILDKKHGEKTQIEEKSWQIELERRGIRRLRLSQSSPGDVELGHKIVREYLKSQFSSLLDKTKPGMLFAKQGCSGERSPIHDMFNYQYKENKEQPAENFKDFCDCVRYIALEQPTYRPPESDKRMMDAIMERNEQSTKLRRFQGTTY